MYGKSGHDQSLIKVVTADDSRGKDVVLVLANFLKTRWTLDISNKVNLKKIYLVSKIITVFKERRLLRKVWRYQMGNQKPEIKEEQTIIWTKEWNKEKTLSRKLKREQNRKPGEELRWSCRVSSSCTTSGTCRVTLFHKVVSITRRHRRVSNSQRFLW